MAFLSAPTPSFQFVSARRTAIARSTAASAMYKARIPRSAEFAVAYSEMLRLTSANVIMASTMEKAMTWISTIPASPARAARRALG